MYFLIIEVTKFMKSKIISSILLLVMLCTCIVIIPMDSYADSESLKPIELNATLLADELYLQEATALTAPYNQNNDIHYDAFEYTYMSGEKTIYVLRYKLVRNNYTTPNGSDISGGKKSNYVKMYLDDIPNSVLEDCILQFQVLYSLTPISDPTFKYNCHSYAWYSQSTSQNNIWLNYPYVYYSDSDRSYEEVSDPRLGDIVCYYGYNNKNVFGNLHSGIITRYTDQSSNGTIGDLNKYIVTSKWGAGGLYEHRGDICPYMYATEIRYYRPRTNGSLNLSDDMSMASASATLKYDGSITDKYVMYELNVSDRMDYLISVQSTSCNVKFYNLHMNYFNVSSYQYTTTTNTYLYTLPCGVTYLRIQNLSTTDDSDITITVVPHDGHSYVYKPLNASSHIEQCKCGAVGETSSHCWSSSSLDGYSECKLCGYLKRISGGFTPIIKSKNAEVQPTFAYEDMAS